MHLTNLTCRNNHTDDPFSFCSLKCFCFIKSCEHLWASAGLFQVTSQRVDTQKHKTAVCVWGAKLYNHQSLGVDQALKNAENADIVFHSHSRSSATLLYFISRESEESHSESTRMTSGQFEQLPECHKFTNTHLHGWSMLGNRYALQNKSFWWISIIQMLDELVCVFLLVDICLWFHMTPEARPALFSGSRFHNQY